MYYVIPDLHIKIEKRNQYEFYIDKKVFEHEHYEGSALSRINTKYNKFLFKINFEILKCMIYYNTDNITKVEYNKVLEEPTVTIMSKNKNDICYISERNTKSKNKGDVGNWYLIKMGDQRENEIDCIVEKIQNESDNEYNEDELIVGNNSNETIEEYSDINYDIESID